MKKLLLVGCLLPGLAFAANPPPVTQGVLTYYWDGTTLIPVTPSNPLPVTGGGAATIADGADVAEGATADAASSVGGTGSVSAKLRRMTTQLDAIQTAVNAALAAQANTTTNIGNVGQTNGDPCSTLTHAYAPFSISSAANTKIVTGTAAKKIYICHLFMFAGAADNVGIVEGSGTNCGTSPLGLIGGNTAATGIILAANQGFESPGAASAIAAATVNANDFCLITSASSQLSGIAVTVQQ